MDQNKYCFRSFPAAAEEYIRASHARANCGPRYSEEVKHRLCGARVIVGHEHSQGKLGCWQSTAADGECFQMRGLL